MLCTTLFSLERSGLENKGYSCGARVLVHTILARQNKNTPCLRQEGFELRDDASDSGRETVEKPFAGFESVVKRDCGHDEKSKECRHCDSEFLIKISQNHK